MARRGKKGKVNIRRWSIILFYFPGKRREEEERETSANARETRNIRLLNGPRGGRGEDALPMHPRFPTKKKRTMGGGEKVDIQVSR